MSRLIRDADMRVIERDREFEGLEMERARLEAVVREKTLEIRMYREEREKEEEQENRQIIANGGSKAIQKRDNRIAELEEALEEAQGREQALREKVRELEEELFIAKGSQCEVDIKQVYMRLEKVEKAMKKVVTGQELDMDWLLEEEKMCKEEIRQIHFNKVIT